MNLLWVENEKSNTIHQTTITLDGEVKITTYEPSAQTNKREAFKLKLFDTGHLIPFLEDRKIPPSDPFNGFRSNRLLNTSDKLCLIVDHVHRVMARDHHAHITLVDKKNGMYDSFFLPYDGTSFILGDSLFLFNAEQDFKTYSFNLHIFSIDQLFKDRAQTKPIYSLEFDSKTNPDFPIPFQKLQEFKHRGGTYVLSDSITTNNTKDIIGSMIRINSRPFLTIYPEGGNLHVRLGLISFSEGAVILPLPAVVVYGFYQIIGKQTWVMDLSYNPTSSEFVSSDMTEIPIWEKHQAVLQSLDKNTKQIRKTGRRGQVYFKFTG